MQEEEKNIKKLKNLNFLRLESVFFKDENENQIITESGLVAENPSRSFQRSMLGLQSNQISDKFRPRARQKDIDTHSLIFLYKLVNCKNFISLKIARLSRDDYSLFRN